MPLTAPQDMDDLCDRSILLLEQRHHVQLANRAWPWLQAPEWEACRLLERWLNERGIDPGFDWLQVFFLPRCAGGIHPD